MQLLEKATYLSIRQDSPGILEDFGSSPLAKMYGVQPRQMLEAEAGFPVSHEDT